MTLLAVLLGPANPALGQDPEVPVATPPPPDTAAAWIAVDLDTGAVVAAHDEHTLHLPASTIKLFSALVALESLPPNAQIPISHRAASMPARKINAKAGQVWDLENSLFNMLIVSANDSAVAVAERVGNGSLSGWSTIATRTGNRLGMVDAPVFNDPSGLDDEFSNNGGSRISAYDLAIGTRAAFERPEIIEMISTRRYEYDGGDGLGHTLTNRNQLLNLYPGAIGGKTGFTERSGKSLVGLAERDGRRVMALVFNSSDHYGAVMALLDQVFATPVSAQAGLHRLPGSPLSVPAGDGANSVADPNTPADVVTVNTVEFSRESGGPTTTAVVAEAGAGDAVPRNSVVVGNGDDGASVTAPTPAAGTADGAVDGSAPVADEGPTPTVMGAISVNTDPAPVVPADSGNGDTSQPDEQAADLPGEGNGDSTSGPDLTMAAVVLGLCIVGIGLLWWRNRLDAVHHGDV